MNTKTIPLENLLAHPANSNVMPDHLVAKLADHIQRTGQYPPLIVRPIAQQTGDSTPDTDAPTYQILDGHHRTRALRQLGHGAAKCVIWRADDREALVLLATLNRLQGQDDPRRRADLVGSLAKQFDLDSLAGYLPERKDQIKKLLEIQDRPPTPRPPLTLGQMPVAVHFFLLPEQKKQLDKVLQSYGGTKEEALMALLNLHHGTPATNPSN